MKYFFKTLSIISLSAFIFVSSSHAGPRPTQTDSSAAPAASRSGLLRAAGTFTAPTVSGAGNLRNYPSAMPEPRLAFSFSQASKPYPTNKWYTSLFTNPLEVNTEPHSNFGDRIAVSPMVAVYATRYPFWENWGDGAGSTVGAGFGYCLGGQIMQVDAANSRVYVSNAMAFAVQGAKNSGTSDNDSIKGSAVTIKNYSDWSVTTVLQDSADITKRMTTTFGRGFVFTYNTFSPGLNPRLRVRHTGGFGDVVYYYDNNGTMTNAGSGTRQLDRIMMRVRINRTDTSPNTQYGTIVNEYQYFGIYAPPDSSFTVSAGAGEYCTVTLTGTSESERYLSIALLKSPSKTVNDAEAWAVFNDYYKYAYNFITDTKVDWAYNSDATLTTNFNFTFDNKRTGSPFISNQTVFALYPHQWKNMVGSPNRTNTYNSIRGTLKVSAGNSFSTKHNFNGIVPFLTYEVPKEGAAAEKLQTYVDYDKNFEPSQARVHQGWKGDSNTYYHGKAVARAANIIPVLHQKGDYAAASFMIRKLKTELATWYSGSSNKYFGYDTSWGGIVGSNPGNGDDFGASKFNDHHFHYGYFIYASAILAMYDPEFASSSQYKNMVDLLVKEIYNPDRSDNSFPFLRNFDVYEGHSYANGRGGADFYYGNDEESTSEAMNAWTGIYLWGLVTNNQKWMDLGIYGYTTQYEATKNYYMNMDNDIWSRSDFSHASVGMLYDSQFNWSLWWTPQITRSVMGIQVMPLTPSMLYLGYDTAYAQSFYNEMLSQNSGSNNNFWRDIWLRFKALYDAPGALADWDADNLPAHFPDTFDTGIGDDGSSMSFSYHFIHFFNALGTVDTEYYADTPSYLVMNKNGTRTFIAYNPGTSNKTVKFSARSGAPSVPGSGQMVIPAGTVVKTQNFVTFEEVSTDIDVSLDVPGRQVYGVYSENFAGGDTTINIYNDTVDVSTQAANSFEGSAHMSAIGNNSETGIWEFTFLDGYKDMRLYYGGEVEVTLKVNSPVAVGDYKIGFRASGVETLKTLASLGFNTSSTEWQTLRIPLTSVNVSSESLSFVDSPFIMNHTTGTVAAVYVDGVFWKRADPINIFEAVLKERRDNSVSAGGITWSSSTIGNKHAVASQYLELSLDYLGDSAWCLQMYTDNKSSVTVADPQYSGHVDSNTVSGLVNSGNPSAEMIPMMWRVEAEVFDLNVASTTLVNSAEEYGMMVWGAFRDIASFSPGAMDKGHDELIIWDRRGFKWDQWTMQRGDPPADKKLRLYFLGDFSNIRKGVHYKSNIILEYFNE